MSELHKGELVASNDNADNAYSFAWEVSVGVDGSVRGTISSAQHPETLCASEILMRPDPRHGSESGLLLGVGLRAPAANGRRRTRPRRRGRASIRPC